METVYIEVRAADWELKEPARPTLVGRVVVGRRLGVVVGTAWDCSRSIEVALSISVLDWWDGKKVSIYRVNFESLKLCCSGLGFEDFWKSTFKNSVQPHDSNTWGVKS